MIKFVKGDFFDYEADIRINTVNCVGVMGAGVALLFKNKFPEMFKDYSNACSKGIVETGKPHVWSENDMFLKSTIINFPTKNHWKNPSEYEYIEKGLIWLKNYLFDKESSTITMPALGCGHGGLDWEIVKKMIVKYLGDLENNILVFEPASSTNNKLTKELIETFEKENIKILKPNDALYPEHLKGRSSSEIYYQGNVELLNKKNISVIVTSKPDEREKKALYLFIDELPNKDFVFLLSYNNSFEIDILKNILIKGFKAIIIIPYGILQLKIRKDLQPYWNNTNVTVLSLSQPMQTWKSYESVKALKFRLKISDLVLINSLHYEKLKNFESDFKSMNNYKFYLNYWNRQIDFFNRISASKIGVNPKTKRPNTTNLINSLSVL
ncbi:MAG: macro domain-containing protein [Bacteroidales bacterium]|nr:macro domain-containing protein [Bacteroidales bacterium]